MYTGNIFGVSLNAVKRQNKKSPYPFVGWIAAAILCFLAVSSLPACAGHQEKMRFGFESGQVAGRDYVPRQLIAGFRAGYREAVIEVAGKFGGTVSNEIDGETILFYFPSEADAEAAARALTDLPDVVYVERNSIMRVPPVIERGPGRSPQ